MTITQQEREVVEQNGGAYVADYRVLVRELGISAQRAARVIRLMRAEQIKSRPAPPRNVMGGSGDFDRGFGIGGLGRYVEDPIIPSLAAMERAERMEAQARYCSRCGESDLFDGVMFSTDPGSGLCDDCYG